MKCQGYIERDVQMGCKYDTVYGKFVLFTMQNLVFLNIDEEISKLS